MQFIARQSKPCGNLVHGKRPVRSCNLQIVHGLRKRKVMSGVEYTTTSKCRDRPKKSAMSEDIAPEPAEHSYGLVENVLGGIKRLAVDFDHVVKMRAGGEAGTPNQADDIAALDTLPFFHESLGEMPVKSLNSESMIELDRVSQLRIEPDAR